MKKNVLIKGILILIAISLLTMGLTGCGTIIATTGTVYIVLTGGWQYDVEMDYIVKFWAAPPNTYALFNVPIGTHFFEATDTWGPSWGYDAVTKYISAGVNYVNLNP